MRTNLVRFSVNFAVLVAFAAGVSLIATSVFAQTQPCDKNRANTQTAPCVSGKTQCDGNTSSGPCKNVYEAESYYAYVVNDFPKPTCPTQEKTYCTATAQDCYRVAKCSWVVDAANPSGHCIESTSANNNPWFKGSTFETKSDCQ